MRVKGVVSIVTILAFLSVTSSPVLATGTSRQNAPVNPPAAGAHAVTPAQLHETVQESSKRADSARQSVSAFLTRADVRSQMTLIGLSPEKVQQRIARLSDAEIARLNQQIMSADQQMKAAGLSGGQIAWIIIGGVLFMGALVVLLVVLAENTDSGYYY